MINQSEHGSFKLLEAGPSILWIQTEGAWNVQTARRYVQECRQALLKMPSPIARVADLRFWEYGEPDITEELSLLYQWMENQPIVRQVDLIRSKLALKLHMNKIQRGSSINISISYDAQETLRQLETEGWEVHNTFEPPRRPSV